MSSPQVLRIALLDIDKLMSAVECISYIATEDDEKDAVDALKLAVEQVAFLQKIISSLKTEDLEESDSSLESEWEDFYHR